MNHQQSNRREFVKRSLAVAGGVSVPLFRARRGQASEAANERVRVGCIGVGGRGTLVGSVACDLGEKIALATQLTLGVLPWREIFTVRSTEEVRLATPRIDMTFTLSVVFFT